MAGTTTRTAKPASTTPETPQAPATDQANGTESAGTTAETTAATTATTTAATGEKPKCGEPVTVKGGTKPCIKDKDHEGGHAMRARAASADVTVIKAASIVFDAFAENETVDVLTEPGERSDVQAMVDKHVKAGHEAWVKAGRPKSFTAAIKAKVAYRFFINPEEKAAYKALLDSAARLYGLRVRVLPVQKHTDGRFMLPWVAMDKRATETSPASAASSSSSETGD